MDQTKPISQRLKYWDDERSQNQKKMTNKVVELISERNLTRINKQLYDPPQTDVLFLTINGVPPREKQYDNFKFPGKVINFKPLQIPANLSQDTMSNQEILQHLGNISMENTIDQINQIVQANGNRVILVCHSFGSFISAMYCSKYPQKVVGYIGLGGPSIRFYQVLKDYSKQLLSVPEINKQFILENYQLLYQSYDKDMKKHKTMDRFHNKFQFLSWILHNQQYVLNQIFDAVRNLPPILILSVYGSRDAVYSYDLCCEYAAYISFKQKNIDPKYSNQIWSSFQRLHPSISQKDRKLLPQEYFIYMLEGVGHGVHYTLSQTDRIQNTINEYLCVLLGQGKIKAKI